jgi:hypothetical protein
LVPASWHGNTGCVAHTAVLVSVETQHLSVHTHDRFLAVSFRAGDA